MPIWNFNISSSLSQSVPHSHWGTCYFHHGWKKRRHETVKQSRGGVGGGADSSLCGGAESSRGLSNASSIWCHYRPSDRPDPVLRCSLGLQVAGRVGMMGSKMLINKWEEYHVADWGGGGESTCREQALPGDTKRRQRREVGAPTGGAAPLSTTSARSKRVGFQTIEAKRSMSYLLQSWNSPFRGQTHDSPSCVTVISIFFSFY